MKSFAWLRSRPRAVASTGIVTAVAVAITTMAFVYEGNPTTEVDLHDGGVWVTKQSALLVGHFNHESKVLDGGLRTTSGEYDILQSGETVLVVDEADSSLTTIDPAMVLLTESSNIPGDAKVVLGGSTVAILDRQSGDLWVVPSAAVGSFEVEGTDPIDTLGEGADVTVGVDGIVHAVSAETAELVTVPTDAEGAPLEPARSSVEGLKKKAALAVTAIGARAAVLDTDSGTLFADGRRTEVAGGQTGVLQQPSADSDAVALATASTFVRVPFDGSEPVVQEAGAQGTPAAPVFLEGCSYSAWTGSAKFIRDCAGDGDDLTADVDGADADSVLRFRVNRDVVVLNDVIGGAAWMASESMQRVDNWNDITPPEGEAEEDEQTTEETVETTLPERSDKNTVPIATDDSLGVRPGRTTVLPVLDNDSDPDGDVLTAAVADEGPAFGKVSPINDGAALQVAVPENATGSSSFLYEIDDGRGGTDTATTSLSVHGWDVNAPPTQKRITTVTVEAGGVVSYNVLPDWIDPDGDDVFLRAVTPAAGDEADFTADGRITYRAVGGTQGRQDVEIVVSDGNESAAGILRFDVRPVGSTNPVTNADRVVVRAGQVATVAPLANDTSSSREPLRLVRVDEVPGATIVPDFAAKTFTFKSDTPAVYYVQYLVAAGSKNAEGLVRVDVLPSSDTASEPIAVRDVALLPSGGEVLVNVLTNDSDPAGGILVVQSVTVEPNSGIAVAVLNHETLRISDQAALGEQVRIAYRISNGAKSAEGEVIVIPIPAPEKLRPPVANDDQVIVRAGDVVNIPVLDNDYHPNGDTLHVAPDLVAPLVEPEDGEIFVSQDMLRFRASDEPGTVYATYEVVDSTGQKDAGYVTIQVLPVNEETNAAPRPHDIVARVLNGSQVRIAVPLDGIDADGDSVQLEGLASPPSKGRVVEVGSNYVVYEAFKDVAGVDAFTYRVRDRLGAEAVGSIRVGIAPAESSNQSPYAAKDAVVMRPGRIVAVPVLANDSDPDGDSFSLLRDGLIIPDVDGLKATVVGDRVVITAPDEPTETSLQYTIRDERGARATAVVQITVADDVPLLRPVARDDFVQAADVEGGSVDVEVLANDEDPDGTVDELAVTVRDSTASVLGDGTVRLELDDTDRLVTYTITDRDGFEASAFIHVPSLSSLPPTLISTEPVEVKSGETIELPLSEYVRSADGDRVVITEAAKVSAVNSDGSNLVKDQTTLVYTSKKGYFGQDALTFEVTDGTGPDDPEGRKATLTIPITVLPPDNQQPEFTDGQVDVAPGEEPVSLELRALTTDPDPEDLDGMSYEIVGGVPSGLSASVEGQDLRVSAGSNTPKGTVERLTIRISDGQTDPVEGSVTVRVTASTRELATANDDIVEEAHQGQTVSVPVLSNDVNPFSETPLELVTVLPETGRGTAEISGDQVLVTPDETFFGTMVVRYRVQDATDDPDRAVEGRIRLTVQGRPDAPGTPVVSSVQDRTVVLSWTPPANNGAEITSYEVSATEGGYSKTCAATTCTLDNLTNNVVYHFTVVAINRVGESDPSAPSGEARPDARPDTPQPPTLVFGDQSLAVSWVTPTTPGSPVEKFTLEISPAPPSGVVQKSELTGNAVVWEGLENGVAYQVRVQAHNRAPDPSSWSGWSATEIPARAPDGAAAPATERLDPVGAQAQMRVTWAAPASNGDAIAEYRLNVIRGGALVNTITGIPGGQTSQALAIDPSTADYTFTVAARNKAGWGADSAPSAPRRAFTPPGAPTNVQASTPSGNSAIVVTYNAAPGNGANANEMGYEYSLNGGGWQANWDGRTIGGLANGATYTVRVRAYAALDGVRYDGAESAASNGVIPYGPVLDPGVSAQRNGTSVTVAWSAPANNGRQITDVQIKIDGGAWESVGNSGNRNVGNGYDQQHTIAVRAYDAAGQVSNTVSASATTAPRPIPTARTVKGSSAVGQPNCSHSSCAFIAVTVDNFTPGNYRLRCNDTIDGPNSWRTVWLPDRGTVQLTCYFGHPDEWAWIDIEGFGEATRLDWY
ncbi:Ig-like domain-containing protein [Microbacterium sp. CFBP9034]|uniref:Ig-like domain-containing protein n=1 Tax=Microbacterium sp. CFBP9034 TaxID=3096540 RepID=UPI002A6B1CB5|nr:Ig-like domain-containing protein [Microbacterium sp. CFBP9034]MDY0907947.1 Ig-like domain-containing protein [Microbacterium sp. CFBP9034]